MSQLEHIQAIEKRLWSAADNLRANSNYASNEYFLPVMGLVFLRHAYSRYLAVKEKIEPTLPSRGGKTRALTKRRFFPAGCDFLAAQGAVRLSRFIARQRRPRPRHHRRDGLH